jgi:hypothetical protein
VAHSNIIGGGSNAGTTTETIVVTCDDGFSGSATSTCTAVPGQTTSAWSTVTCAGVAAACARLCLCRPAGTHVCHDAAARAILRPPPRRRTILLRLSTLQVSSPEPTSRWRPRLPPSPACGLGRFSTGGVECQSCATGSITNVPKGEGSTTCSECGIEHASTYAPNSCNVTPYTPPPRTHAHARPLPPRRSPRQTHYRGP